MIEFKVRVSYPELRLPIFRASLFIAGFSRIQAGQSILEKGTKDGELKVSTAILARTNTGPFPQFRCKFNRMTHRLHSVKIETKVVDCI